MKPPPDKDWKNAIGFSPATPDEILTEIVLRVAAGERLRYTEGVYWRHLFTEDKEGNMTTHFIQSQS